MTMLETPHSAVLLERQVKAIDVIVPNLSSDMKQQLAEALVAVVKFVSFPALIEEVEQVRELSMSQLVPSADSGVMNNSEVVLNFRRKLRGKCFIRVLERIGIAVDGNLSNAIYDKIRGDEPSRMAGIDVSVQYVIGEAEVSSYVSFDTVTA